VLERLLRHRMMPTLRFPPLAVPFAALAGAATWLWCDLVHRLHHGPAFAPREHLAVAGAALVGAVAGALLGPPRPTEECPNPQPSMVRVTAVLIAAGLAAGVLVTSIIAPKDRLGAGAVEGILSAVPLMPLSLRLIAARGRADQARPGSIIARTERRAVFALVAAAIAGLTTLALPASIASLEGYGEAPQYALLIAALAGALGLGVLLADCVASIRVKRLMALEAKGENTEVGVDFGVGDDVVSRVEAGTAYRGGGRTVTAMVGDPDQARATLQRSLTRGAVVLAFVEIVGITHGLARDPEAAATYQATLCRSGRTTLCREAALLSERSGLPDEGSSQLHDLACKAGVEKSCLAVYLLGRRADARP